MFFRISTKKSGGKVFKFVQLVRSVRVGKVIHAEVITHLGRLEEFIEKQAPNLMARLKEISGQVTEEVIFENGQDAGNVLAIMLLWKKTRHTDGVVYTELDYEKRRFVVSYGRCYSGIIRDITLK